MSSSEASKNTSKNTESYIKNMLSNLLNGAELYSPLSTTKVNFSS